jgi:hypothetical protein
LLYDSITLPSGWNEGGKQCINSIAITNIYKVKIFNI